MTQETPIYKDPKQPVEARVRDLLSRMTLEEKADQLLQGLIGKDVNPNNLGGENSFRPTIGSILSYYGGSKARNAFQRIAVENTRLGIPIIWGYDVIHGWRTCFPVSLAQACSFRPELTEKLSRVSALEAWTDGGVDWTFSPMVEVAHDPRWGRVVEGYGEDPVTAQAFTTAAVVGYQGKTPEEWKQPGYIAACLKHFVGYSSALMFTLNIVWMLLPDVFFLYIFILYTFYIVWEGATIYFSVGDAQRMKFTTISTLLIIATPHIINKFLLLLMPGLRY